MNWLILLTGCWGSDTYIVEGTVVEVATEQVTLDHEYVEGLGMQPMVMPFKVSDPGLLKGLEPGHRVYARFEILESGGELTKIRITGKGPVPERIDDGPAPVVKGQKLPRTEVHLADGTTTVVGEGQDRPTLLTFLYTTCPLPEFCPATVARFQAVQAAADPSVRLLAVTLDPTTDTPAVLQAFAERSGADPAIWQFGRVDDLPSLALYAGLTVTREKELIAHSLRVLKLDREGRLVERFDDLDFSTTDALSGL